MHAHIHRVLSFKYHNRAPLLSYAIARLNYKFTLRVTIIITDLKIDTIYKMTKATTTIQTRILMKNFFESELYIEKLVSLAKKKTPSFELIKSFVPTTIPRTLDPCLLLWCVIRCVGAKMPPPPKAAGLVRLALLTCTRSRGEEVRRTTWFRDKTRGGEAVTASSLTRDRDPS